MKKHWLILTYTFAVLGALALGRLFPTTGAVLAQNPPSPAPAVEPVTPAQPPTNPPPTTNAIKGDLVIDFMGSLRGMVEPCG
ncbi:MAG TPA: hypothetical protein PKK84_02870 [Armatimonadota bacterium]|jgi:hypothetical protein|nr:hypothetical protein [Armatimonadota bacterium]